MIEPGLDARVGAVSERTGKGRHTTTHFELHPLRCGGFLGDTPGIREFGIWEQSKQTLGTCFRDFDPWRSQCRFASCTHSHEPGCAVKEAVGERLVSKERYESYLKILQDLPDLPE
jgi:ribosome biogenesis GTPase